jgi:DNA-binding HxlR family transcriptional regulator/predicted transcriptional regulator
MTYVKYLTGEMVMLPKVGSNKPFAKTTESKSLLEVLEHTENYCKNCETVSPMICVERCDVWKVKNEILETRRIVNQKDHAIRLLNALKNERRLKILGALMERSRSLRELQEYLKKTGHQHSLSTIVNVYVKPLLDTGLMKRERKRYQLTFYGKNSHGILKGFFLREYLPIHSCCYEEEVLRELKAIPRTFNELAALVPPKSLSRVLTRLRKRRLITKNPSSEYVFYHKIKDQPKIKLSPTEKRIFEAIPKAGISARDLSKEVGINLRRTYKYLRRLRDNELVFALRMPRTYELTQSGTEIAQLLEEVARWTMASLSTPIPVAR